VLQLCFKKQKVDEGKGGFILARILVVDDSGIVRRNMEIMLKSAGHEVVAEVDNGLSAYAEYKKKLPDLVTMDLTMPGMDGIETMQKIIAEFPLAKIIVVSGINQKDIIVKAIRCGACHFIVKPMNQEKVLSVVNMVLLKEIDHTKRLELAEKLAVVDLEEKEAQAPSYTIQDKDGKYILVNISEQINNESVAKLGQEIENLLFKFNSKFIFDFGKGKMSLELLPKINNIVGAIKKEKGVVRAVSVNAQFVQQIQESRESIASGLAEAIRFLPNS